MLRIAAGAFEQLHSDGTIVCIRSNRDINRRSRFPCKPQISAGVILLTSKERFIDLSFTSGIIILGGSSST